MRPRETGPGDNSSGGTVAEDEHADRHLEFSLPQADGGKDAWLFLAACFIMEALVWGFPFAFGVFQDFYRTHEPFAGSSSIAIVGTSCLGVMYLDMPLIMAFQRKHPRACLYTPLAGLFGMCISLAASSFAQKTWHLVLTQGILYGLSGSIAYGPCILYMEQWFVRRRGLAYGIMWSGTSLGGFIIPLLLETFLSKWGFRTALRIWTTTLFALTLPATFFIKPRLPISATTPSKSYNLRFLLSRTFLLYQSANIVEGMGYFLPAVYLPTYARSVLGAGSLPSALTVILINMASVFGMIVVGSLSDRWHSTTCILISSVGAVMGTLFLWGLAVNLPVLYSFCIVYGFFAGSYVSSWPAIMKNVVEDQSARRDRYEGAPGSGGTFDPLMIFGFLTAGRGIGNLVSGPLSETLIRGMPWRGQAAGGYGSGYGPLIAFTGVTAVIGGVSFVWRRVGWL